MARDFTKTAPPIEGATSPRRQAAIRRLVGLLARQAACEVIASDAAPHRTAIAETVSAENLRTRRQTNR